MNLPLNQKPLSEEAIRRLELRVVVLEAMKGDLSAFDKLYVDFQPRLLYYVRRLVGKTDMAEDVMQETWIAIVQDLRQLRDPDAFTAWCYRIARNLAFKHAGKYHKMEISLEDIPPSAEPISDDTLLRLNADLIHQAMDELPELYREIIFLRYFEDLTYEQISTIAKCNIGTVRSRLHAAKKLLAPIISRNLK